MVKYWFIFFFTTIFFSCNNSLKKNDTKYPLKEKSIVSEIQGLQEKADNYYMNGKNSEAILIYDKLISIDSTKSGYYFKRGHCKSKLLKHSEAILDYNKSIQLNYSKKEFAYLGIGVIHRSRAIFDVINDHDRIAEYDTALYYYNECLKIDPTNKVALRQKAEVMEILKK